MASERYTVGPKTGGALNLSCVLKDGAWYCECPAENAIAIAAALNHSTDVAELAAALKESHAMLTESLKAAEERFDELCDEDKEGYREAKQHERRLATVLSKLEGGGT